jgi:hypothetical protein
VWAYDFVTDRTYDGKAYRMLTVMDEFRRECLAIAVGRKIYSSDVLYTLADLFIEPVSPWENRCIFVVQREAAGRAAEPGDFLHAYGSDGDTSTE